MPDIALPFLAQGWLQQALTSRLTLMCAAIVAVSLFILAILVRASIRIHRADRIDRSQPTEVKASPASLAADARGTTTVEFALVFPILLLLALLMVQAMFLMAGNMYVHYAAYQAARRAIVEIPQDYTSSGDYPANEYSNSKGSLKYDRIHRAAYLALLPVAGRSSGGGGAAGNVVDALSSHYSTYGATAPNWIDRMLAGKVAYAADHTEIEVLETNVEDDDVTFDPLPEQPYRFGLRDVVTVRLKHELNLGVPFASRFFADGDHGDGGTGRYTVVVADASLTNEGVPLPLPDKPKYDRITPALPTNNNQNNNNPNLPGTVPLPVN